MADESNDLYQSLLKGGGIVFLGMVIQLGISFFGMVLIARIFGRTNYGAISIGVAVLEFGATFSVLGLKTGVARYLPRYENSADQRGVLTSALQLSIPASIVIGGLLVIFADTIAGVFFGDPSVGPILLIMGFTVPAVVLVRIGTGAVQGFQLPRGKVVIQNLTIPLTRIILIIAVLILGFDIIAVALSYSLAYVAAAVAALYYLYRHTPLFTQISAPQMHGSLLKFSIPLVFSSAMGTILSDIDTLLLGASAAPTGDVGIYRAIYPVASILPFVLTSFTFLFLPIISKLHAKKRTNEMRRMYQVVTKWALFMTTPLFFTIAYFPESVIGLTFGEEYIPGAFALQILSLGFLVPLLAGPNASVLTTIGDTREIMYINVLTAVVNIILNLLLIPEFSYVGASAATAAAYTVQNLLLSMLMYKETNVHPITKSLFKPLGSSLLLGSGLYLIVSLLGITPVVFFLSIFIFSLVHGLTILKLGGIEREEIMLVLSFEEKFGIDLGPVKRIAKSIIQ